MFSVVDLGNCQISVKDGRLLPENNESGFLPALLLLLTSSTFNTHFFVLASLQVRYSTYGAVLPGTLIRHKGSELIPQSAA